MTWDIFLIVFIYNVPVYYYKTAHEIKNCIL